MSTTRYLNLERSLENLKDEAYVENFEVVREYIDHCAAECISDSHHVRQIQSLKMVLRNFAPDGFRFKGATEKELKQILAGMNRSDYAEPTKNKIKSTIKKFYRVS